MLPDSLPPRRTEPHSIKTAVHWMRPNFDKRIWPFEDLTLAVDRLLESIQADANLNRSRDLLVATILCYRLLATSNDIKSHFAAISHSEICKKTGLSLSAVRHSLGKLTGSSYFKVIRPSKDELRRGGWTLKYLAQFEAGMVGESYSAGVQ